LALQLYRAAFTHILSSMYFYSCSITT